MLSESPKKSGLVRRGEDSDVRLEGAGRFAFAEDLELSRAARHAVKVGLPLNPHRLPLPRPNKSGRSYSLRPARGSGVGALGALAQSLLTSRWPVNARDLLLP